MQAETGDRTYTELRSKCHYGLLQGSGCDCTGETPAPLI